MSKNKQIKDELKQKCPCQIMCHPSSISPNSGNPELEEVGVGRSLGPSTYVSKRERISPEKWDCLKKESTLR